MAEAQVEQKDVKLAVAESSTATKQSEQAKPPVDEKSTSEHTENRIPQSRLNEVIQERNRERELRERNEERIREYEAKERSYEQKAAGDAEVSRLVNKYQMTEAAARDALSAADAVAERKNRDLNAQVAQHRLAEWHRNMETKHSDYREMSPDMERVFSGLDQTTQRLCTASPTGLEMLYQYAKSGKSSDETTKRALSSTPGQGSRDLSSELSRASIAKMDASEYKKRQVEINAWTEAQSRRS